MNPIILNWGPAAFIVGGYLLGIYFQSRSIGHLDTPIDDLAGRMDKRIDDLRVHLESRIADLRDVLRSQMARNQSEMLAKFAELDHRFTRIESVRRIVQ